MEKAMAPHSSNLAWKIPWMEEPGGLQSVGLQRVGHDWSHLAAAAAATVQLLSHAQHFSTLWTVACQASLSFTISWNLLKLMCIGSVIPSNHLIFCCFLLFTSLLPYFTSPALNLSQHQGIFQWVSSLHQVAKVLEFELHHQSFQWIFRTDFL